MTDHNFQFRADRYDGAARCGEFYTPHGTVHTPAFMPVGTAATVKGVYPEQVAASGADMILANTYHLMLRPGPEIISELGGLHSFMNWHGPILTDSGGFQVMSLAKLRKITEHGVVFQSHIDGRKLELTPEKAVEVQLLLGSDIQMQLDECLPLPAERPEIERAMHLSLRWAERARATFGQQHKHALFAIVQGGDDIKLRQESATALAQLDFAGYGIGGLAVGEPQAVMLDMVAATVDCLGASKPRYLMGVGSPDDLLAAVALGIDMFDCVMPTRAGRHGHCYTRFGRINLKNARFRDDQRPLDGDSDCAALAHYSRAYLHHLIKSRELLGAMLLSWANIHYYQALMSGARHAIAQGQFQEFCALTRDGWQRGL